MDVSGGVNTAELTWIALKWSFRNEDKHFKPNMKEAYISNLFYFDYLIFLQLLRKKN